MFATWHDEMNCNTFHSSVLPTPCSYIKCLEVVLLLLRPCTELSCIVYTADEVTGKLTSVFRPISFILFADHNSNLRQIVLKLNVFSYKAPRTGICDSSITTKEKSQYPLL